MQVLKPRKKVIIVGGGPAGMMAAIELCKTHDVHLFEKEKTLGRKFLVAGKGGFNLTNSTTNNKFTNKYTPESFLKEILLNFNCADTQTWFKNLDIPTYIGSSGRVFPEKGIKPIAVLNALKSKILTQNGKLYFEHEFMSFEKNKITFLHKEKEIIQHFDICIFALGGASWSITGSNGNWTNAFEKNNIQSLPFEASNCGLVIDHLVENLNDYIGEPLKNISITSNNKTVKGEAVISNYGLEGNAIYPLAALVRAQLKTNKNTSIQIDFKPFNTEEELLDKIKTKLFPKNYSYTFKLSKVQLALIKAYTDKETYLNPILFAKSIKNLIIPIDKLRPIEEAISTTGGIDIKELNSDLSLKKIPNIYIAGEMFDWDTITGGYLLQGCFSTAFHVSQNIKKL